MRHVLVVTGLVLALGGPASAEETPVGSKIVAVGLFKNGLAVVRREATVVGPGSYRIDDVPSPVHGTWFVECDAPVETAVRMRDVDVPIDQAGGGSLQEELAGKRVIVHLREGKNSPVKGTVVRPPQPRREEAARPASPYGRPAYGYEAAPREASRFLVLENGKGRTYVDLGQIAALETEDEVTTVKKRRPQLVLTVGERKDGDKKPVTIGLTYLARGLSWAPSYRVDISDPKSLALEQTAVLRNELADLEGATVSLISGFPSIRFAHVTSPLAAQSSWAGFFNELNQRIQPGHMILSNAAVVRQQARVMDNEPAAGLDLSATPAGEGVDVHYQSIGPRTLAEGDSLSLTVARGKADYERIVEWLVPDNRDADGNPIRRGRGEESEDYDDSPWDALRFRNPLPFPMTTAPALVVSGGRFNGQQLSTWANTGEETVLHVTRALSVRTRHVEHEDVRQGGDERNIVWIGGRRFRQTTVQAELTVSNHRKEAIALVIRRRFSGDLVSADGDPRSRLREEGVYSVNRRNELVWSLPLKSGEEKKLTYRYTVLVSF